MTYRQLGFTVIVAGGCGVSQTGEAVRDLSAPDLGISLMSTAKLDHDGDHIFELRGLDGGGNQVALVRRRIGSIADLSGASGSEMILTIGEFENRIVSRERALNQILPTGNPAMQAFLELGDVSSALAAENIIVFQPRRDETAYAYAYNCDPHYLQTSPVVNECCWTNGIDGYHPNGPGWTLFKSGTNDVLRYGPGTPCTSSTGGPCGGTACYYGPNGFARPQLSQQMTGYHVVNYAGYCVQQYGNGSPFPTMNGIFPAGQGCPGGDTGAGEWDYY